MELLLHPVGYISLFIFILAYAFVVTEEVTHLRKSKPVLFAAGLIWGMIAWMGSKSVSYTHLTLPTNREV